MGVYQFSSNLPAPINEGPEAQSKEGSLTIQGDLIAEGLLKLAQFASAPDGAQGALYYDTTANEFKGYKINKWASLGGWDGVLANYTTAERNNLSLVDGLIVFNTSDNAVQICISGIWRNVGGKISSGTVCTLDGDCDSTHCVDGVCCATTCPGNCNRCNVAGSEGICTDTNLDCTGNCDVCSSGNCAASVALCIGNCDICSEVSATEFNCSADVALCTGNCDQCTGSDAEYNCSANAVFCTGDCDICTEVSATKFDCAASNAFCSSTTGSCYCSGSGTVFNCQSCPDTHGACGHPTCSSYSCGNAYDNGVSCSACHYCSSGSCTSHRASNSQDAWCTGCKYCNATGGCRTCDWSWTGADAKNKWDCSGTGYTRCTYSNQGYSSWSIGSKDCGEDMRDYCYVDFSQTYFYFDEYECVCN